MLFYLLQGKTGPSLMDKYEYVMYGKLYKYGDERVGGALKVDVYISFGGLLMLLRCVAGFVKKHV